METNKEKQIIQNIKKIAGALGILAIIEGIGLVTLFFVMKSPEITLILTIVQVVLVLFFIGAVISLLIDGCWDESSQSTEETSTESHEESFPSDISENQRAYLKNIQDQIKYPLSKIKGLTDFYGSAYFLINNDIVKIQIMHASELRLPEDIDIFTKLKVLFIENCILTKLPESICDLPHLEKLILYDSKITSLPESVHKLKNLTILNFENNPIYELPESFWDLTNLKELNIKGTNLNLGENIENIQRLPNLELLIVSRKTYKSLNEVQKNSIKALKDRGCRIKFRHGLQL